MNIFLISAFLRQLLTLFGVIHIVVLRKLKNLAYLSLVRPHLEYTAAAWDPYGQRYPATRTSSTSCCQFCQKKIIVTQLLSLVCSTNLVGCPCSNVVNTLLWRFFTRRWIIFRLFLWITSQFHHGILEPPTKINLSLPVRTDVFKYSFFLGPLPIGTPSHWLFVSCSRLSPSTGLCRTRHPPIIADYHDTPAVTGGLHPLLDIAPKNRRQEWTGRARNM